MKRRQRIPVYLGVGDPKRVLAKQETYFAAFMSEWGTTELTGARSLDFEEYDDDGTALFTSSQRFELDKLTRMLASSNLHGGEETRREAELKSKQNTLKKLVESVSLRSVHGALHLLFQEEPCSFDVACQSSEEGVMSHRRAVELTESALSAIDTAIQREPDAAAEGEGGLNDFVYTLRNHGLQFNEIAFLRLWLGGASRPIHEQALKTATDAARKSDAERRQTEATAAMKILRVPSREKRRSLKKPNGSRQ